MRDRFWSGAEDIEFLSLCGLCVHKHDDKTCKAFPDGIPESFLSGDILHTKSVEGDSGIVYESDGIDRLAAAKARHAQEERARRAAKGG